MNPGTLLLIIFLVLLSPKVPKGFGCEWHFETATSRFGSESELVPGGTQTADSDFPPLDCSFHEIPYEANFP